MNQGSATVKAILEGGTDAAAMVIFDPVALGPNFDDKGVSSIEMMEALAKEGRLYWLSLDGDGGYTLMVLVNENIPSELSPYAHLDDEVADFQIPSGKLYFAGAEYAFFENNSFLNKHPHMGSSVNVEPGVYHLKFYTMEYPEDYHEDKLREVLPPHQFRLHAAMSVFTSLGCVSLLAVAASLFILYVGGLILPLYIALLCAVVFCIAALVLARTPQFQAARSIYREIQRNDSDYIAIFIR